MAPNIKRKQKISSKEESSYVEPWQNLPEKLLNFLKKQPRPSKLVESIESSQNGLIDPNDPKGQLIQFNNAIIFEGKFYALSLQGTLAVIEEVENQFQVMRLKYLVESNGEILLIFLILERSNRVVDKVEVFKLKIEDFSWLKLENLGDRTLFAGIKCGMPVPASQIGCRNNCVYFTHHYIDGRRLYDMGSGCISPCYDDAGSEIKDPMWEEPIIGRKKT
ncbi:hypothetical protein R3W88_003539 [Solanum pinnatisectum]|uniref:KIB1-4 beta-propeller domain-containing protein n=1 Tax=Solanum pinnatisectum TaxID=50273 RepID=A0AAV9MT05_9SOLN|nr:hypothetical protein R3W88_003539 [Solanum pinnatisectum]